MLSSKQFNLFDLPDTCLIETIYKSLQCFLRHLTCKNRRNDLLTLHNLLKHILVIHFDIVDIGIFGILILFQCHNRNGIVVYLMLQRTLNHCGSFAVDTKQQCRFECMGLKTLVPKPFADANASYQYQRKEKVNHNYRSWKGLKIAGKRHVDQNESCIGNDVCLDNIGGIPETEKAPDDKIAFKRKHCSKFKQHKDAKREPEMCQKLLFNVKIETQQIGTVK